MTQLLFKVQLSPHLQLLGGQVIGQQIPHSSHLNWGIHLCCHEVSSKMFLLFDGRNQSVQLQVTESARSVACWLLRKHPHARRQRQNLPSAQCSCLPLLVIVVACLTFQFWTNPPSLLLEPSESQKDDLIHLPIQSEHTSCTLANLGSALPE